MDSSSTYLIVCLEITFGDTQEISHENWLTYLNNRIDLDGYHRVNLCHRDPSQRNSYRSPMLRHSRWGFDFAVRVCVQENELGQFNAVADIVAEQLTHVHVELIQCRGDGTACGDPGTGNDEDVSTLVNTNSSHQTYGQVRTDTLIEAM
jgi:hypothetical protein